MIDQMKQVTFLYQSFANLGTLADDTLITTYSSGPEYSIIWGEYVQYITPPPPWWKVIYKKRVPNAFYILFVEVI